MSNPQPGRRDFLKSVGVAAAALPSWSLLEAASPTAQTAGLASPKSAAETAVKALYDTLTEDQKKKIAFDWNYIDPKRGLLRTHVSNNWQITPFKVKSEFFTSAQQGMIHDVFKGLINPEWYDRFLKQLKDDSGGKPWGAEQSIALFGKPGDEHFEFVLTGRHQTLRADGNTEAHVAFGGPIFYGHAAKGFNEAKDHPGNVFWNQAQLANGVYQILDEKQRKQALLPNTPKESAVQFRGKAEIPGLAVGGLSDDVKKQLQKVLTALIEPFRAEDQHEALAALKAQGGLDATRLSFFADEDVGEDGVWDNWRLEGPSFVWYYRGSPHVHVWVNVADDAAVKLNARG